MSKHEVKYRAKTAIGMVRGVTMLPNMVRLALGEEIVLINYDVYNGDLFVRVASRIHEDDVVGVRFVQMEGRRFAGFEVTGSAAVKMLEGTDAIEGELNSSTNGVIGALVDTGNRTIIAASEDFKTIEIWHAPTGGEYELAAEVEVVWP